MTMLLWMPINVRSASVSQSRAVLTIETMNTSSVDGIAGGQGRRLLPDEIRKMQILGIPVLQKYLSALQKLAGELTDRNLQAVKTAYQQMPYAYQQAMAEINENVNKAYNAKVKWLRDIQIQQEQAEANARAAAEAAAKQQAAELAAQQQAKELAAATEAAAASQAPVQQAVVAANAPQAPTAAPQQPEVTVMVPEDHAPAPVARTAPAMQPNTININGQWIGLEDSQGTAAAPYDGNAGYWMGSGSTTDGATTHIIGHNPGIFNTVLYLGIGSRITVVDRSGNARTYTVYALYDVNDAGNDRNGNALWGSILGQTGESISLQTCIDDYWNRMVLAR